MERAPSAATFEPEHRIANVHSSASHATNQCTSAQAKRATPRSLNLTRDETCAAPCNTRTWCTEGVFHGSLVDNQVTVAMTSRNERDSATAKRPLRREMSETCRRRAGHNTTHGRHGPSYALLRTWLCCVVVFSVCFVEREHQRARDAHAVYRGAHDAAGVAGALAPRI